jgi:hypothetical protein
MPAAVGSLIAGISCGPEKRRSLDGREGAAASAETPAALLQRIGTALGCVNPALEELYGLSNT